MSNQITFRLNDEDTLRKLTDKALTDNVSISVAARNMLVELAGKDKFLQTKNIKLAVRNLTVLQRYISIALGDEKTTEIFNLAFNDESEILQSLGVVDE